jgi:hypothetical protein
MRHRKVAGDFNKLVLGTELKLNKSAIYGLFNDALYIDVY